MWVFFGLLSLTFFGIVSFHMRLSARWKGQPFGDGPRAFEVTEHRNKGALLGFSVGVREAGKFTFVLRPEGVTAGLAKRIGLSVEHQTRDPLFDAKVYVVSDDPIFCRALNEREALRRNVLALFSPEPRLVVKEIRCAAGRLWVRYDVKRGFKPEEITAPATHAASLLREVGTELSSIPARFPDRLRDPFIPRAAVILACSTALAAFAGFSLLRVSFEAPTILVDPGSLLRFSIGPSLVGVGLLVVGTVALLGRTSRAHLVLLEVLIVGGLGAMGTGYILCRDANTTFDSRPGAELQLRVHGREVRGTKSRSYYLWVDAFGDRETTGRRELRVSRALYDSVAPGGEVRLVLRRGGLGHPWVESIEAVRPGR